MTEMGVVIVCTGAFAVRVKKDNVKNTITYNTHIGALRGVIKIANLISYN